MNKLNNTGGKISICIPTYNRPNLICQLLDSILLQTYKNYEVIITDNSDTDDTQDLINKKYQDNRIKYIKNEKNLGMDGNTLKALTYVDGEFFTFTPDDDIWIDSKKLEKQVNFLKRNKQINCCFSNALHINYDGANHFDQFPTVIKNEPSCEIINSTSLLLTRQSKEFICILTGLIRSELLDEFRESWKYGSEEYFLWYIGGTGQKIGYCYDLLVAIRDGEHNWQISDNEGGLINFRSNNQRRAKQLIEIYSNLINKHSAELILFGSITEIKIFKILIDLIGFKAFSSKKQFQKIRLVQFVYLLLYALFGYMKKGFF